MLNEFLEEINLYQQLSIKRTWTKVQEILLTSLQKSKDSSFFIQLITSSDRSGKVTISKEELISVISAHTYFSYELKKRGRWYQDSKEIFITIYFHHPITKVHTLNLYLTDNDLNRILNASPEKLLSDKNILVPFFKMIFFYLGKKKVKNSTKSI